jgi:CBS domain-containing protein
MTEIRNVMTRNVVCLSKDTSLADAARNMRSADIGDVVVSDNGTICGIVTDRDIVIRAVAAGRDPNATTLGEICSRAVLTVRPDDDVQHAIDLMRRNAVRRLPVVENGRPVGIVSLGDLAQARDPGSVLGALSSAPPQH